MMSDLYCVARFNAKPGKAQELQQALKSLISNTHREEGCLLYQLTEEVPYAGANGEPWDCVFIEQWASREAFEAHCAQPYIKDYFEQLAPALVADADVRLFRPL
ncbi:putative quinol monooxygenase [Oceanisphaera sp. KMM 10153]|uniref:putative quinol monooxygenase n=1 Tax=Oceanisphaera submarina TaxID=3390193 RepID=UPI0039764719